MKLSKINPARLLTDARKFGVYVGEVAGQLIAFGVLSGTALHWTQLGLLVLGALGVYGVKNTTAPAA